MKISGQDAYWFVAKRDFPRAFATDAATRGDLYCRAQTLVLGYNNEELLDLIGQMLETKEEETE